MKVFLGLILSIFVLYAEEKENSNKADKILQIKP